ncbi:glycosyltransferase [Pararhodonellum marinum]|uniref:glycosyltransferase n=1 Tax=Pararhodonellum marinum TaxID=2755358 RepID=UPI0018906B8F|nr:glycosyltransferase [Pararhodonellum marinum]
MMVWVAFILVVLLWMQDMALFGLLQSNFKNHVEKSPQVALPLVSILVPSRDEAEVIKPLLASLAQIDYPQSKLEFIMGDDNSQDETGAILEAWCQLAPNRHFTTIHPSLQAKVNGKAHALAQLVRKARGEVFLFTDADCEVNPLWAKEMVRCLKPGTGLVTGTTKVRGNTWFTKMQALDWWMTLGIIKVTVDLGFHLTSMGNNMLVTREAYDKTGGFDLIPFSLTEDLEMAKAVAGAGFTIRQQVSPESLIETLGKESMRELLQQRKRWMHGAMSLPFIWKFLLFLQVMFFPAILFLISQLPLWGMGLWLGKVVMQGVFLSVFAAKTETKIPKMELITFDLYYLIVSWSTILYYFWPGKTTWKGRAYP